MKIELINASNGNIAKLTYLIAFTAQIDQAARRKQQFLLAFVDPAGQAGPSCDGNRLIH